jgi:hypothetical protein
VPVATSKQADRSKCAKHPAPRLVGDVFGPSNMKTDAEASAPLTRISEVPPKTGSSALSWGSMPLAAQATPRVWAITPIDRLCSDSVARGDSKTKKSHPPKTVNSSQAISPGRAGRPRRVAYLRTCHRCSRGPHQGCHCIEGKRAGCLPGVTPYHRMHAVARGLRPRVDREADQVLRTRHAVCKDKSRSPSAVR